MKKILFCLCLLCLISCKTEHIQLHKICHLDDKMEEISGMTIFPDSPLIWSINDSGSENHVYGIDENCKIAKEVKIQNAENVDWEDLAKDTKGTLFIGDFGNNKNKRKDLVIYKVNDFLNQGAKAKAKKIEFSLEDQDEFPPDDDDLNFGFEAFLWKENHLYLFTKNRKKTMDGIVKMYRLPEKPGKYVAEKIGEFKTCDNDRHDCWITSATTNPEGDEVYLLSNTRIWKFSNFEGDDFFNGKIKTYFISGERTQKESITIKGKTLYISDEGKGDTGQNMYNYRFK